MRSLCAAMLLALTPAIPQAPVLVQSGKSSAVQGHGKVITFDDEVLFIDPPPSDLFVRFCEPVCPRVSFTDLIVRSLEEL